MFAIGNQNISKIYIGDSEVSKIYLGNTAIYESDNYVTFTAIEDNSSIGLGKRSTNQTVLEYSTDGLSWTDFNTGTSINLNSGNSVCVRGKLTGNNSNSNYTNFKTISGKFDVSGNINSLWNYENLKQTLFQQCGYRLFSSCGCLEDASKLEFPATSLTYNCYLRMFDECTNLKNAPNVLPATNLKDNCYENMFKGCTNLVKAPELPATTLASSCYECTFSGCTSLTTAPALPATTLSSHCYQGMFINCTSLTKPPELPATTLADFCYTYMFNGCTSLMEAPELPATALTNNCYAGMFKDCTSLTEAPELPATTLTNLCYSNMFNGCTGLMKAPELPATALTYKCYSNMFNGCTNISKIKCLATSGINQDDSTSNWLDGVASTGTFVKHTDATWPSGVNGVPYGWEEIDLNSCVAITSLENNSVFGLQKLSTNQILYYYNYNDSAWVQITANTFEITLNNNTVYLRGKLNAAINAQNNTQFKMESGTFSVSGNINSLWDYENLNRELKLCCGYELFRECTGLVDASNLLLPSMVLTGYCYEYMFAGCTSLTKAPELPATTLAEHCYDSMFQGCTRLTKAPELPATELTSYCYRYMFQNCTSLTKAPELPATTLDEHCYEYMFNGCSKLNHVKCMAVSGITGENTYRWLKYVSISGIFEKNQDATWPTGEGGIPDEWFTPNDIIQYNPTITFTPVDTVKFNVLSSNMFFGASKKSSKQTLYISKNKTNWMELTHFLIELYSGETIYVCGKLTGNNSNSDFTSFAILGKTEMSGNINSLWDYQNLDKSLYDYCGFCLFKDATELVIVDKLTIPSYKLSRLCYSKMFENCTSLTTAPKLPATILGENCYSSMFEGCTSLTNAPKLPATTLTQACYMDMFRGCTSLTTAPELPAATLLKMSYYYMFYGCCNLNYIKCLAKSGINSDYSTDKWVKDVPSTGTFVKHPDATWPTGNNGIQNGWTVTTATI